MLCRVDAEAIDPEAVDPRSVDLDHALHDARVLGVEIVEADEVAHLAGLALERRVAPVVIVDRVIEPGRNLDALFRWLDRDSVSVIRIVQLRKVAAVEACVDRRSA